MRTASRFSGRCEGAIHRRGLRDLVGSLQGISVPGHPSVLRLPQRRGWSLSSPPAEPFAGIGFQPGLDDLEQVAVGAALAFRCAVVRLAFGAPAAASLRALPDQAAQRLHVGVRMGKSSHCSERRVGLGNQAVAPALGLVQGISVSRAEGPAAGPPPLRAGVRGSMLAHQLAQVLQLPTPTFVAARVRLAARCSASPAGSPAGSGCFASRPASESSSRSFSQGSCRSCDWPS